MNKSLSIGVLAFHGDVIEHIAATRKAADTLSIPISVIPVRTKKDIDGLNGLILPGGESTTLSALCQREGIWELMKKVRFLFGTCAGAILLAKTVHHAAAGQQTLAVMDITIDRNAYGRQVASFEETVDTSLGSVSAVFIRAPKIIKVKPSVHILAEQAGTILACEQETSSTYMLACSFHPELSSLLFHMHFLKKIIARLSDH